MGVPRTHQYLINMWEQDGCIIVPLMFSSWLALNGSYISPHEARLGTFFIMCLFLGVIFKSS